MITIGDLAGAGGMLTFGFDVVSPSRSESAPGGALE